MEIKKPKPICFAKVENICLEYNEKCKLSSLSFYPTGGLLYHVYADILSFPLPADRDCTYEKPMFSTPDIDGYFMIVPTKLNLNNIRKADAYTTYEIALEAVKEAQAAYRITDELKNVLSMLTVKLKDFMEASRKEEEVKDDHEEWYDGVSGLSTYSCKLDVHLNVVVKPLYNNVKNVTGFFFHSNGTELVLNKWTTVEGYNHVFIVDPIVHLFDQFYTLYIRSTGIFKKAIEDLLNNKPLKTRFKKLVIKYGRFKMDKTAFRIKVFCQNIYPLLTVNKLFQRMKGRHFKNALNIFESRYQEEAKKNNSTSGKTFLETYGSETIESFCDRVLNEVNLVCNQLNGIFMSELKF